MEMELVVRVFMEEDSLTKTSMLSTQLDVYLWPTLVQEAMEVNSSSPLLRPLG